MTGDSIMQGLSGGRESRGERQEENAEIAEGERQGTRRERREKINDEREQDER
jgi:hypothetical protein